MRKRRKRRTVEDFLREDARDFLREDVRNLPPTGTRRETPPDLSSTTPLFAADLARSFLQPTLPKTEEIEADSKEDEGAIKIEPADDPIRGS